MRVSKLLSVSQRGNRSMKRKRGAGEDSERKREGSIFIVQHHSDLACFFAVICPDATELGAEMKSSLMARHKTDRQERAHGHNS